jgi:N-acyl-phosphatidylethanolamine-hydrolysing phospholipase D
MLRLDIITRRSPGHLRVDCLCIILCITILFVAGACTANCRVIKNEALDDWDGKRMRYKNLFPPAYGYLEETEYEMNHRLWGGWLFEWNDYRIYFAGDTGYSAVFKDITNREGEVDICLMPISAWFQRHWHFAPEDALRAAEDLECKVLIPWGWGTWIMSFEHILDPPRRLRYAWARMQPQNMELRILKMGETYGGGELCEDECVDSE